MASSSNPSSPKKPIPPEPGFMFPSVAGDGSAGGMSDMVPSAPPMQELPGYGSVTFDRQTLPPPPAYSLPDVGSNTRDPIFVPNRLTEEEAKECLTEWVSSKCCYGTGALNEIVINDIQMSSSYQYHLETMSEKRDCSWTFEPNDPNKAVKFNFPVNGPGVSSSPPNPWSIPVEPDKVFEPGEKKVEVPNTSTIRACHFCSGCGKIRCTTCAGMGFFPCTFCNGAGVRTGDSAASGRCLTCNGTGRRRCIQCNATGLVKCKSCDGFCSLRYFVQLHVTWIIRKDDYVSDATGLKEKYIKKNEGVVVAQEEGFRVFPFPDFPDKTIPEASRTLIEQHDKQAVNLEKIIRQRHNIKEVRIAIVFYKYKEDRHGIFYVFGNDIKKDVYFSKYPNRCCYCCSIL